MTRYKYYVSNGVFHINLLGHANYSHRGTDIVCSSISTVLNLLVNTAIVTNTLVDYTLDIETCNTKVAIRLDDKINGLIESSKYVLKELEKQYPRNVRCINEQRCIDRKDL